MFKKSYNPELDIFLLFNTVWMFILISFNIFIFTPEHPPIGVITSFLDKPEHALLQALLWLIGGTSIVLSILSLKCYLKDKVCKLLFKMTNYAQFFFWAALVYVVLVIIQIPLSPLFGCYALNMGACYYIIKNSKD